MAHTFQTYNQSCLSINLPPISVSSLHVMANNDTVSTPLPAKTLNAYMYALVRTAQLDLNPIGFHISSELSPSVTAMVLLYFYHIYYIPFQLHTQ